MAQRMEDLYLSAFHPKLNRYNGHDAMAQRVKPLPAALTSHMSTVQVSVALLI